MNFRIKSKRQFWFGVSGLVLGSVYTHWHQIYNQLLNSDSNYILSIIVTTVAGGIAYTGVLLEKKNKAVSESVEKSESMLSDTDRLRDHYAATLQESYDRIHEQNLEIKRLNNRLYSIEHRGESDY